jgi:FkbM family methyltransferase
LIIFSIFQKGLLDGKKEIPHSIEEKLAQLVDHLALLRKSIDDHRAESIFSLRKLRLSNSIYLGDHLALTQLENGLSMYVDTRSRDVGIHLLNLGRWESNYTEVFKTFLFPGATVLDVGANLGWYSLIAAPIVGPSGKVFAVEPNPHLANLVYMSLRTNGFASRSVVLNIAASDKIGILDLIVDPEMPGSAITRVGEYQVKPGVAPSKLKVSALPLDDAIGTDSGPIHALKMDIEGFEGVALQGMQKIITRSPNLRMLLEWGLQQDGSPVPRRATAKMLDAHNFVPYRISNTGQLTLSTWDEEVTNKKLTNLAILKKGDPLGTI